MKRPSLTVKQKVTAALTAGLLCTGAALTGVKHAAQRSTVGGVAATGQSAYEEYRDCIRTLNSELLCDLRVFGTKIEEDDHRGRWYCDLRGNRVCGAISVL